MIYRGALKAADYPVTNLDALSSAAERIILEFNFTDKASSSYDEFELRNEDSTKTV